MAEEEEVEAARAQIERSRADLAATADDLHDRLSPKQAAGRQVAHAKSRVRDLVGSTRRLVIGVPVRQTQQIGARMGEGAGQLKEGAAVGLDQARQMPDRLRDSAQGNPMGAGVVAFGLGMLAAAAFPATSTEREAASSIGNQLGPVRQHLQEAAQDIGSSVKESAQDAAQQVQAVASDATQELAQQGKGAAADVAAETKSAAQEARQ